MLWGRRRRHDQEYYHFRDKRTGTHCVWGLRFPQLACQGAGVRFQVWYLPGPSSSHPHAYVTSESLSAVQTLDTLLRKTESWRLATFACVLMSLETEEMFGWNGISEIICSRSHDWNQIYWAHTHLCPLRINLERGISFLCALITSLFKQGQQ